MEEIYLLGKIFKRLKYLFGVNKLENKGLRSKSFGGQSYSDSNFKMVNTFSVKACEKYRSTVWNSFNG